MFYRLGARASVRVTMRDLFRAAAFLLPLMYSPAPAYAASSPAGAIVFVGTDNNIYYAQSAASKTECLTCPSQGMRVRLEPSVRPVAFRPVQDFPDIPQMPKEGGGEKAKITEYGWPTFSPDAKRIAYVSTTRTPQGETYSMWIYDLAHRQASQIYESRTERVIYIYWLPDNQHISFLLNEPQGLSLMFSEAKPGAPIRVVMNGAPLYFNWRTTGDRLVVHTAGSDPSSSERVAMVAVREGSQEVDKVLSSGRTPFKTPSWSPDQKHLAFIANYHGQSNIVVADADGEHPRTIVSLPVGDNSFVWSPDSHHLAYATTVIPHEPTFRGIKMVNIDDATSRDLTRDDVAAYFFSPDARYLAWVAVPEEKPYYVWKVADLKNNRTRDLGRFLTTQEESIAYRFFDQLTLSHSTWAPNSDAIIFAGVRLLAEPDQELHTAPPPSVWVLPIDGSAPRQLDAGVLAFYSSTAK